VFFCAALLRSFTVLTDYVVLMLRNHKCASEVGVEMQEMVGAEAAEAFALWLARRPEFGVPAAEEDADEDFGPTAAAAATSTDEPAAKPKRIVVASAIAKPAAEVRANACTYHSHCVEAPATLNMHYAFVVCIAYAHLHGRSRADSHACMHISHYRCGGPLARTPSQPFAALLWLLAAPQAAAQRLRPTQAPAAPGATAAPAAAATIITTATTVATPTVTITMGTATTPAVTIQMMTATTLTGSSSSSSLSSPLRSR
jgi:hypothetical protein